MTTSIANRTVKLQPIEKLVVEIRAHLCDANNAQARCMKLRIAAGMKLIELRERIEVKKELGEVDWWKWCETNIRRSRKDCERLMRLAGADDPEAALEADNAKARDRMRKLRASVRSNGEDEIEEAEIIEEAKPHRRNNAEIERDLLIRFADHLDHLPIPDPSDAALDLL